MDGKVTVISLVVTNKARSVDFFTEKVGFDKKTDFTNSEGYRWVTVGPKGQELELALWEVGSTVDPSQNELSKKWSPGRAPPILLQVADCKKAHQAMSARGVEFVLSPMEHPWGTVATFKDPDGNLFTLTQLKGGWPKP